MYIDSHVYIYIYLYIYIYIYTHAYKAALFVLRKKAAIEASKSLGQQNNKQADVCVCICIIHNTPVLY